jgi:hypothetical protein
MMLPNITCMSSVAPGFKLIVIDAVDSLGGTPGELSGTLPEPGFRPAASPMEGARVIRPGAALRCLWRLAEPVVSSQMGVEMMLLPVSFQPPAADTCPRPACGRTMPQSHRTPPKVPLPVVPNHRLSCEIGLIEPLCTSQRCLPHRTRCRRDSQAQM